jgi:hypothetical protein
VYYPKKIVQALHVNICTHIIKIPKLKQANIYHSSNRSPQNQLARGKEEIIKTVASHNLPFVQGG